MIRIDPIPLQFGLASVVRVLGLCASYWNKSRWWTTKDRGRKLEVDKTLIKMYMLKAIQILS